MTPTDRPTRAEIERIVDWYKDYQQPPEADITRRLATYCLELMDALEPFASIDVHHLEDRPDDWPVFGINNWTLTMGDVRRLRAVLPASEEEKDARTQ